MLKKYAILGFVLLFVGGAAFAWVFVDAKNQQQQVIAFRLKHSSQPDRYLSKYNQLRNLDPEQQNQAALDLNDCTEGKTQAQFAQEQQERLKADIDKLAAGQMDPGPAADVFYGPDWQSRVSKYSKRKAFNESIVSASVVCMSFGGLMSVWCMLLAAARLIMKEMSVLWQTIADLVKGRGQLTNVQAAVAGTQQADNDQQHARGRLSRRRRLTKRSKVLVTSGWHNFAREAPCRQTPLSTPPTQRRPVSEPEPQAARITMLLSDQRQNEPEDRPTPATESVGDNIVQRRFSGRRQQRSELHLNGSSPEPDIPLNAQAQNLQQQIDEFRQLAQSVHQVTLEHSKPLDDTLKELTQQISAIREYASHQQDRVEKLQEGYDWSIVRTFCLRIIRCIDNAETRIGQLAERNVETPYLKEVRDELLFVLESSGVEQFEPEINSDYRGQEKFVEATGQKLDSGDPQQIGKIAEVVRPGYQYIVDENNVKVVRTAQVRLFG